MNVTGITPNVRRELQPEYVRRGVFEFNPNRHDFGAKQLLGQPIASRGLPELDEALDHMARTFCDSDGDIARVLRALFDTLEFWRVRKFKDPMRYVISAVRLAYDERQSSTPGSSSAGSPA